MEPNSTPPSSSRGQIVKQFAVPISIVAAGVLIAIAVVFTNHSGVNSNNQAAAAAAAAATNISIKPVSASDHILGNPNAPVILVEYADTECPYCKLFQQTLIQIMDTYGPSGDVAWVYRYMPLDEIHPKATNEANAVECAGQEGGPSIFWKYLDQIFSITPSNNGLNPSELPAIASQLGLNVTTFNECLANQTYNSVVQADYQDGVNATGGNPATPFTVIVTKQGDLIPLAGAQSYSTVEQAINTLLQAQGISVPVATSTTAQ